MADSGVYRVNGLPVPSFYSQEAVDKLKDFELRPDDVWIVSYPKCGSTWTQQLVRLIRNKGVQDNVKVTDAVPWLEVPSTYEGVDIDRLPKPRAFKSHFPYESMPCGQPHTTPCKYIYVTRNPKDVAVSNYCFSKLVHYPDLTWDEFWRQYMSGNYFGGDFFDHLLSWLKHKDNENVLFLKHEDMKKDLRSVISQIAQFIGIELLDGIIAKIAYMAEFKSMKNDSTANRSWEKIFEGESKFLRKGIVGDWMKYLTSEQSSQIDAIYASRIEPTGFKFDCE